MKNEKTFEVATLFAAFVASLCCVGPLLFALAGLGAFGAATFFASLRPYLLVVAAILLAAAFYYTYRPRKVVCEDGSCKSASADSRSKLLLWLTAALTLIFALSPYLTGALLSTTSQSRAFDQKPSIESVEAPSVKTVSFRVEGMTCGGCEASVESVLKSVDGVREADVDLATKTANVRFDPTKTNPHSLAEAVKKAGFTPVL